MIKDQKHRRRLRRRPNGAAAEGGRPIGSVFLIILYHRYLWIFLIQSLYIPYIYNKNKKILYFLALFHIFSLVCFLIYGVKRRQVLIANRLYAFDFFISNFMIFYTTSDFSSKIGPKWDHYNIF